MPDRLEPGPYRVVRTPDGTELPFYIIPFDKHGRCEGPRTRDQLLDRVSVGDLTDVFLFSHGWNNDWTVATRRYNHFLEGYLGMRERLGLPVPAGFRALLAGVFWPSTALAFGQDEEGPAIAAGDPLGEHDARAARQLAEALPADAVAEFYHLAQAPELDEAQARRFAELLRQLPATGAGEDATQAPTADDLVTVWRAAAAESGTDTRPPDLEDFGLRDATGPPATAGPQVAGIGSFLKKLDPRHVIRMMTVWQMKDRAGTVGANGVHELLTGLLSASSARVHLLGHSYGAKVVLSAAAARTLPRRVRSILLLQPAVSHLCFAATVPETHPPRPGGYRGVLDRVEQPILSTFSANDSALTKTFHLALRRADDLGEARIAAPGEPPSRYAALGGFGPRGAGERLVDIEDAGRRYDLSGPARVVGLRGTRTIAGHGDISNESTWWALYCLVA